MDLKCRLLSPVLALVTLVGLLCFATPQTNAFNGRESAESIRRSQPAGLAALNIFPAAAAKNVCPDSPLRITFNGAPIIGAGEIQVLDAANNGLVERIDLSISTRIKSIGGQPNYSYYPVIVSNHLASIYLSRALDYGKTYYVKISPGAFKDAGGRPFAGFDDEKGWRFSTRVRPPVAGGKQITVAADGTGDFATVQGALDFVPEGNSSPITIFIRKGTYEEIIFFTNKNNLTILGEDRRQTIITYANNDRFNNNAGGNPFGPGAAAPGAVPARSGAVYRRGLFLAHRVHDLTIANLTLHNTTALGGSQAEAIILNGSATAHAIITNVDLYSFQDTLQINGQAYVSDCYIEGDVDFMWGTGPVFFENCHARSLRSNTYYTQIRNPATNHGFIYHGCVFDGAPGVAGNFLSRIAPVRFPYSEVVLLDCVLSDAVGAIAWRLDQSAEAPNVHYWEYHSHSVDGAPVDMSGRLAMARQLKLPDDHETVANYSDATFVLGGQWKPGLSPIITIQPAPVTVNARERAFVSVTVAAVPAPTFQWQRNGKNIEGATRAEYAVEKASRGDAGSYRVVVANASGRAVSAPAKVTIR
jgi:pectin methylesterase-like acyl-CoA thioesterase